MLHDRNHDCNSKTDKPAPGPPGGAEEPYLRLRRRQRRTHQCRDWLHVGLELRTNPNVPVSTPSIRLQQLRDEVLQFYYSTNKFILGNDTKHTDSSSQSGTVDEWRRLLGQYARDLRDVTIVIRNIRSHSNPHYSPMLNPYEHLATRARFPQTGAMVLNRIPTEQVSALAS